MALQFLLRDARCIFLNCRVEYFKQSAWGRGEQLVAACFSMMRKLAWHMPVILFIDEVDIMFTTSNDSMVLHEKQVCAVWQREWLNFQDQQQGGRQEQHRICIVATTNNEEETNDALFRRFKQVLEV